MANCVHFLEYTTHTIITIKCAAVYSKQWIKLLAVNICTKPGNKIDCFTHIIVLFGAVGSDVIRMFVQQQCAGSVRLDDDIFHLSALTVKTRRNS